MIDAYGTTYVVVDEHTLGYVLPPEASWIGVLAGKPQFGGCDPVNGPVSAYRTNSMRRATPEDFDYFRVCPPPHLTA